MPTNKQRREAARRHLERQLQTRQARESRRRKVTLFASIAGTVVLIVVVAIFVVAVGNDDKKSTAASTPTPTPSTSASTTPSSTASPLPSRAHTAIASRAIMKTTGPCKYAETAAALKSTTDYYVGLPPDPAKTPTATHTVTFTTNRGVITAQFVGADAPCNVQSLEYLITKKFYNNTACHRLVTTGIFVVQCGDPSATGAGGPTYETKDENLKKANYVAGAIAMANSGANTNSSQFFFITKDSNSGLSKAYTVIGKVTGGLDILTKVAAGGASGTTGDGRPNLDLIFKTVTVK